MNIKEQIKKNEKIYSLVYPLYYYFRYILNMCNNINYLTTNEHVKILKLKNCLQNKRCFIVGNGPSLTIDDLEQINSNGDISFASNRIYGVYENTVWRPTYYICQDSLVLSQIINDLPKIIDESEAAFLPINIHKLILSRDNLYYFFLDTFIPKRNCVGFSNDISKRICEGTTVTYSMIQIAVYMGFKEIYLLGVDHNYCVDVNSQNSDDMNYFKGIKRIENATYYSPRMDISTKAYNVAEKESKNRNYKIYNATRGGKLEVFERVDFDSLFKE